MQVFYYQKKFVCKENLRFKSKGYVTVQKVDLTFIPFILLDKSRLRVCWLAEF